MFINISNHPSKNWSDLQITLAEAISGDNVILDIPFPNVDPRALCFDVREVADMVMDQLKGLDIETVMVQGEMTLTYLLVKRLLAQDIRVVATTTERVVKEVTKPDGTVVKTSVFQFVDFREYG